MQEPRANLQSVRSAGIANQGTPRVAWLEEKSWSGNKKLPLGSQGPSGFSQHQPRSHLSPPLSVVPLTLHPHISSQTALHIHGFLFNQLTTVQEFKLFSLSPRPWLPPRKHFGDLWCLVLKRWDVGDRGCKGPALHRAVKYSFFLCVKNLLIKTLGAMKLTQFCIKQSTFFFCILLVSIEFSRRKDNF